MQEICRLFAYDLCQQHRTVSGVVGQVRIQRPKFLMFTEGMVLLVPPQQAAHETAVCRLRIVLPAGFGDD